VLCGLGVLRTALKFRLQRFGLINSRLFSMKERCVESVFNTEI
jgi:hypothetical protein